VTDTSATPTPVAADEELPLLDEPLPVELANTLYRGGGVEIDFLADGEAASRWVQAVAPRLGPVDVAVDDDVAAALRSLRDAVREVLLACLERRAPAAPVVRTLNAHARRAPSAPRLDWPAGGQPTAARDHLGAAPLDVLVAVVAGEAIALVSGPQRAALRRCEAPACGMLFVKDHPRRTWCNPGCGHRARQARYYRRKRGRLHA